MPFKFEKLVVWQLSLNYADKVNTIIQDFPKIEIFALSDQFRRAADSIALNVAEGSIGQTDKEQQKFIGYSIRSLAECVTCLYLAQRRNYLDTEKFKDLYSDSEYLLTCLMKFRKALDQA